MMEKRPCVYILASRRNGTLYVGVTSDLVRRVEQHRSKGVAGFVRKYGVYRLVFAEFHETMGDAILREKRIKKCRISTSHPLWQIFSLYCHRAGKILRVFTTHDSNG